MAASEFPPPPWVGSPPEMPVPPTGTLTRAQMDRTFRTAKDSYAKGLELLGAPHESDTHFLCSINQLLLLITAAIIDATDE